MNDSIVPKIAHRVARLLTSLGLICFLLVVVQVGLWAMDNAPPFVLLSYAVSPAAPGEVAVIRAKVKRDLDRRCSVNYSRMFFDSNNVRTDLTQSVQVMTADAVTDLSNRNPGGLVVAITVPVKAAKGTAEIVTPLEYICNPYQQLRPINILLVMKMEVI